MLFIQCPNSKCKDIFPATGFRPVTFTCPNCGLEGEWFSEHRKAYLRWSVTPMAIDYVVSKAMSEIVDDGITVIDLMYILNLTDKAINRLERDVAKAQRVDPHGAKTSELA